MSTQHGHGCLQTLKWYRVSYQISGRFVPIIMILDPICSRILATWGGTETFANFLLLRCPEKQEEGSYHLNTARRWYEEWGARKKTELLMEAHSSFFASKLASSEILVVPSEVSSRKTVSVESGIRTLSTC